MSSDSDDLLPGWKAQRHRRLCFRLEVEVNAGLMNERAHSFDLSAGGIFVDTAQAYLPGQRVELSLQIDEEPLQLKAEIVHLRPMVGFGARFVDLTQEDRRRLLRFVHRERATQEAQRMIEEQATDLLIGVG